ncbi:HAD family hydrolase, partial [Neisseria meningitidis]|uniref:HAD family hydrolase n=1 Tax=Neisseria meningitidis TaxID=487 RepID=UPI000330318A
IAILLACAISFGYAHLHQQPILDVHTAAYQFKSMLYACGQIHADPQHTLYVGDAERDIQAGRNAGMKTVLAEWGYIAPEDDTGSWQADFHIRTPLDLLECLDKIQP